MLLEIFGFCALAIFAILVYAETGKRKEVGVIAAFFLIILSLVVNSEGIQFATSQTVNAVTTMDNVTNQTLTNMTVAPVYTTITLPYVTVLGGFNGLFALAGILFAIFMVFYYAFGLK